MAKNKQTTDQLALFTTPGATPGPAIDAPKPQNRAPKPRKPAPGLASTHPAQGALWSPVTQTPNPSVTGPVGPKSDDSVPVSASGREDLSCTTSLDLPTGPVLFGGRLPDGCKESARHIITARGDFHGVYRPGVLGHVYELRYKKHDLFVRAMLLYKEPPSLGEYEYVLRDQSTRDPLNDVVRVANNPRSRDLIKVSYRFFLSSVSRKWIHPIITGDYYEIPCVQCARPVDGRSGIVCQDGQCYTPLMGAFLVERALERVKRTVEQEVF